MSSRAIRLVLTVWGLALPAAGPAAGQEAGSAPSGGGALIPLPVLFYQPETGTGFGVAATYYHRGGTRSLRTRPSEVGLVGVYTSRRQIIVSLGTQLSLDGDRLRIRNDAGYSRFPNKFWGVGNDTPDAAEEGYTPHTWRLAAEAQRQVGPGWYAGGTLLLAHRRVREVEAGGQLSGGAVPGTADGRVVAVGLVITRDTRDNTVFPRTGRYHRVGATVASGIVGSDFEYTSYTVDLRTYVPALQSHVLAVRALGEARTGTPPFDFLPHLGGEQLLRGYYEGRFRDHTLVAVQAEYRAPVFWRVGLAGFVAVGQVAPALDALRPGRFKTSVGAGLRFQISRREGLNLRADYGWGVDVDSGGLYLSIGEAF